MDYKAILKTFIKMCFTFNFIFLKVELEINYFMMIQQESIA